MLTVDIKSRKHQYDWWKKGPWSEYCDFYELSAKKDQGYEESWTEAKNETAEKSESLNRV